MPRVNLLPWRDEIRRDRERRFYISLGITAVVVVVLVGAVQAYIGFLTNNQNELNNILTAEIEVLNKQIDEIKSLKAQKAALTARMEVIENLQKIRPQSVHMFDDLVRAIPPGVFLKSAKQKNQALSLTGSAQSNARVSTFMRNIEKSEWITAPNLEVVRIQEGEGGKVRAFTLEAKLDTKSDDEEEQL